MCTTPLWLLATLAFASLSSLVDGSLLGMMAAPNILRVDTAESIFVECHNCTTGDIRVDIRVMSSPTKAKRLATSSVILNEGNHFQSLGQITIPSGEFNKDPNMKQYVILQVQFPDNLLEKAVLVSFHSGYIFIQTDKTLYTPDSRVNFRMFALTPRMEPVERDTRTQANASIAIEIVTPDGIVLPLDPVSLKSGIHSGHIKLGEVVSLGLWKVVARFPSTPQQSFSAEFEVKEYVLPSFEVKLTPSSSFLYVDDIDLTIKIKATYLFGQNVNGAAYVVFGVMVDGQKRSFPSSLQRVPVNSGTAEVKLLEEHITRTFQNINELVGKTVYVAVSVLTESGSELVEAELRGIPIVSSPYTIHFKKTPKYFIPGLPFDVTVEVLNPDETPAQGIPVVSNQGELEIHTSSKGMAQIIVNTEKEDQKLTITVKTNASGILRERQASATMEALPYSSKNKDYIHIGVERLEESFKINFSFSKDKTPFDHITYLIMSRGQLVKHDRLNKGGQIAISQSFPITKDMLPSVRIIAYYHTADKEVISNSVWLDVKDTCMGSLKLEATEDSRSYEPRNIFGLKVTGDPGAIVGLVAVDKGVYVLNNQHRLTQKKVWDEVEKHDTGCTPGGGKDSMSVFSDAGLLFESSADSGTPPRIESKCQAPSRRKRATTITEVTTSLVSQFKEALQRECCLDGMRDTPLSYTCEVRSEYITDGTACVEAFLRCCKELERERAERKQDSLLLARSEEDDNSYMDSTEIVTRTNFPESWMWFELDPLPHDTASCEKEYPLPDSITTWQITGISLSRTHGICVADPLEVIVWKQFFIDLRLPYSAVRGEQIEVKAILHNYSLKRITVRVDLIEKDHVCSSAHKRGKYRQEVEVERKSSQSVPFIIIPMKEGEHDIEVKAAVKNSHLSDGIMKKLRVVPEGVLVKSPQIIILDPKGGKQETVINSDILRTDLVPDAPTSTEISVTGREQVSQLVENAISGTSMGSLIRQPSGCGEQNMISMTLPVIATMYLDKTNQWETVGFEKRNDALHHIKTGFQNELAFRKTDGSFAAFLERKTSAWLTAYVSKVFAMANSLIPVDKDVICDAVKFLILNTQQPDGMFTEVGSVIHGEMIGDVHGQDSDASMTAFCLIAMQESSSLCTATVNSLPRSREKAVAYLEKHLPRLTNPYAVAMTSYALANEEKMNWTILYKPTFVSPDRSHWPVPKGHVYTLEATAYALLALVKAKAYEDAKPVVRWFNKQQRVGGDYGSTQATIIVYQAITEYWANAQEPDYNLNINILLPRKSNPLMFNFKTENHYTTRTAKFNDINQDVTVIAEGTGEATLKMVSMYYAMPKEKESNCQQFNLSVQLQKEKMDDDETVYKLKIEVLFKNDERDATMSILDIGLLTGFTVNTDDLKSLSKGRARTIAKYEMDKVLSERGSLIIYLEKVSNKRPEEIAFRIHQKLKVGILQPATVSVYEYYQQTSCVKFYHPERESGKLLKLCRNKECACAEENCSMQKKEAIDNNQRFNKLCESTPTSKIDFGYKVRVEDFEGVGSTDIYTMQVLQIIKEASYDKVVPGTNRTFLNYPHCREALALETGKTYLIMGTSQDIYKDDEKKVYNYVLGERTWIEYWPTQEECQSQTKEHREACVGMEDMVFNYEYFGCQQK